MSQCPKAFNNFFYLHEMDIHLFNGHSLFYVGIFLMREKW